MRSRPHEICPDCGAGAYQPHHQECRWFDAYARSKLPANNEEAPMLNETPEPQPDDDNGDEGDEGATIDQ